MGTTGDSSHYTPRKREIFDFMAENNQKTTISLWIGLE
jgi:hypothetical protein